MTDSTDPKGHWTDGGKTWIGEPMTSTIGWQPIETAPKTVGGYFAIPVLIGFVEWGDGSKHVGPIVYYECYDNWEFMELDCDFFPHPTHWMPLPNSPETKP